MHNSESQLIMLVDIIRKDSGVNNSIDATEQLSLLLLLKYFYEAGVTYRNDQNSIEPFSRSFYNGYDYDTGRIKTNFFTLQHVFDKNNTSYFESNRIITSITLKKIEDFLTIIPFKIQSTKILEMVLRYLDHIDLNEDLANDYDMLIVSMINSSISSGAFHTPRALVSALVRVTKPEKWQKIYDPAMGTGRFFVESKKLLNNENLQVKGNDLSPFACLIGSLNLLLNGINIDDIYLEDSFLFEDNSEYDLIFSGIPFGKASDINKYDYAYHGYTSSLETMFLKHTMSKLAKGGKAVLIVPDGLLFNCTKELKSLRRQLLTQFDLHAVLSLPHGILGPHTGIKVSALFFDNTKIRSDIWFYELKSTKPLNKTNKISDHHFSEFIELFSKRPVTDNSCLISKKDVLNSEPSSLSFELPSIKDEINNFQILGELSGLKDKKKKLDKLWLNLEESLSERQQLSYNAKVTLGEILTMKAGKLLTKAQIKDQGDFPVYGANGIIGYHDQENLFGENILIGRVGAQCGNVYFIKGSIWLTNNSFSVQLNSSFKVYLPYLAHVLRSLNLNKMARGSAQPSISFAKIKDIEISLPVYEKQIELSEWFDKIKIQYDDLLSSFKLQSDKFSELTNYSIISNCIK